MKSILKRSVSALLIAAIFISAFSFAVAAGYEDLNGSNWMSGIPDDRYIYEINVPGTHDSATAYCKNSTDNQVRLFGRPVLDSGKYAKTQSLTLSEQLNAGVRYLDLRFSAKDGELLLCHGNNEKTKALNIITKILTWLNPVFILLDHLERPLLTLDTEFYAYEDEACTVSLTCDGALKHVKDFLKENPTETVIITVKKENGDTDEFLKLFKEHLNSLQTEINPATQKAYLYTQNGNGIYTKMPTMSEVRGQIILMTPFYKELQTGDTLDAKNGAGETSFMGMTFNYENHWSVPAGIKTIYTEKFIDRFSSEMITGPETHLPRANVLKTNSSFVPFQSPEVIAEKVNGNLYAKNSLTAGRYYGWIMGDFMTEDICSAIWRSNY